ncbi:hypothetical protein [Reinekea sp.]|jgi:hypothetical protein|uniref:hypothetical protein n=1 Tax=Reinekea sp. TaxID=1970455 RepID=UPI003988B619
MSDPKNQTKLYADPMGMFAEPAQKPSAENLPSNNSDNLAQQAALERQAAVINDTTTQKKFCQEFTRLETWLVFSEAIPICLGIHPRDTADIGIVNITAFNEAKALAKTSNGKTLKLINPHNQPALWRVKPADFVPWMIQQKLNSLQVLKYFYLKLEQDDNKQNIDSVQSAQIFGAAFAILVNAPSQCIDMNGNVSVEAVYNIMKSKANTWFKDDNLPLDKQKMIKLLTSTVVKF